MLMSGKKKDTSEKLLDQILTMQTTGILENGKAEHL